jgi:hypothetical protein
MQQTLPFISAARRLRGARGSARPTPGTNADVTPINPPTRAVLDEFEREVHAVREAIFRLADSAHSRVSQDYTQLHVSLQIVSNELGQIERVLADARAIAPGDAARAS